MASNSNVSKRIYFSDEGILKFDLEVTVIVTDIYSKGIAARIDGFSEESFFIQTPEFLDANGKCVLKRGDKIKVIIKKI